MARQEITRSRLSRGPQEALMSAWPPCAAFANHVNDGTISHIIITGKPATGRLSIETPCILASFALSVGMLSIP
jgi:hypothetical protein